jgi:hypothetical protein
MEVMTKRKTSLNVEDKLWASWVLYAVKKTGSTYKVSELTAEAIIEYMRNHPIEG